ncbi:MAG: phage portal protein [Dehalococcoidia bacterium]|nr:phage portal protein [Dehalococcoidia bacterium]MDW8120562.1 phage portal protein [Chloroflexota bacterium]
METLPQRIARMDGERLRRYAEYLAFAQGHQWSTPARRGERRLTFNYARAFAEKVTSYLLSGLTVTTEPWDASPQARERALRAQEVWNAIAEANALDELDYETELDTAILGDGCYKVIWDSQEGRVRITAPDVQGIFAWWTEDDPSRLLQVASRYRLSAEECLLRWGVAPKGPQGTVVEGWTATTLQVWVDDTLAEERPNPYGFIPFLLFPNLREPKQVWGTSDLVPIMEPQRELNRAFTQLSAILELSGNPIAVLEGVEHATDIAVQPGAVWEVPERARAYLLDLLQGGGVRLHVDYIDLLYRTLHDLSETPRTAFGDNARNLSGVALEMELHPLLQKVRRKRLIRTSVYRRRAWMALALHERMTGEPLLPVRLRVVWGPILPQDRGRLAREQQALVASGLSSRRRAMALLGVEDPEAELRRIREEQALGQAPTIAPYLADESE